MPDGHATEFSAPPGRCARCGDERQGHPWWCAHCIPIAAALQASGWSIVQIAGMGEAEGAPTGSEMGWQRSGWGMGRLDGIMLTQEKRAKKQKSFLERRWRAALAKQHERVQREVAARRTA